MHFTSFGGFLYQSDVYFNIRIYFKMGMRIDFLQSYIETIFGIR